jgi:DNA-binding CsgD family transcriptional regulator
VTRQPQRLADLLPGVVADLANRHHATNGTPPPMTAPSAVSPAPDVSRPSSRKPAARPGAPLTKLERKILVLIAEGLTDQEIADQLGVRLVTQKTHAKQIYAKLRAKNRQAAVNQAWIKGLLGPTSRRMPAATANELKTIAILLERHGGPKEWDAFTTVCARLNAGDLAKAKLDKLRNPAPSWLHVAPSPQANTTTSRVAGA